MLIKKFIRILFILLLFSNSSISKADTKTNIIKNIENTESMKFDFIQITNHEEENGICFLKRPHYLKCEYKDKNNKELIVNKKRLVIYHKRYEKIYNYPLSKSYFIEILDKRKFSEMITGGVISEKTDAFLVNCFLRNGGEIVFYFNNKNFDLKGWDLKGLNENKITFKILNIIKNSEIRESFFNIPSIN
ncbi:MAG: hypothetical protein CMG02_02510 [Candidatus Marinimicrobia bacterium]|nr:hypothetical protein [Candidatus Neomarinimicrobiota bacterium]RPG06028.1 MAG: outer membrane lipoprotein carrier protein LolA [Pelagibacteraceae bacterium TMED247]